MVKDFNRVPRRVNVFISKKNQNTEFTVSLPAATFPKIAFEIYYYTTPFKGVSSANKWPFL